LEGAVTLPVALLLLASLGLWLAAKQFKEFRQRAGDFSEWIVSDATPLNRRLWRANAWMQLILLPILSVVCLVGAFQLAFGK
jgi:hypothetical protein